MSKPPRKSVAINPGAVAGGAAVEKSAAAARTRRPALLDVARLHAFLVPKSRDAAKRAIKAIRQGVKALGKHPEIGRPVEELSLEFREWVIEFGHGAYVVLYHYDGNQIMILAVRHGREAGY